MFFFSFFAVALRNGTVAPRGARNFVRALFGTGGFLRIIECVICVSLEGRDVNCRKIILPWENRGGIENGAI